MNRLMHEPTIDEAQPVPHSRGGGLRPWPATFRKMIYEQQMPDTSDFTWLTIENVRILRGQCVHMRSGSWTKMRLWLMRQQLSDKVRRALGGRPGRLLKNQRRAKDSREYRGVRTTRKKGGKHALPGTDD